MEKKVDWHAVKNLIYKTADEESIFIECIGDFNRRGKKFKNPFRADTSGGCNYFKHKNGHWLFADHAAEMHIDIIKAIELRYGLTFIQAVTELAVRLNIVSQVQEMGLEIKNEDIKKGYLKIQDIKGPYENQSLNQLMELKMIKKKKDAEIAEDKKIGHQETGWTKEHVHFINQRKWSPCPFIAISPIWDVFYKTKEGIRGETFGMRKGTLMSSLNPEIGMIFRFSYSMTGSFGKSKAAQYYAPYSKDKKKKFVSCGDTSMFLPQTSMSLAPETWIYVKSFKEAMNCYTLGYNVLGKCGEGALMDQQMLIDVCTKYDIKSIAVLGDNDKPGLKLLEKKVKETEAILEDRGVFVLGIHLPQDSGFKDLDDCMIDLPHETNIQMLNDLIKHGREWKEAQNENTSTIEDNNSKESREL